MPCLQVKIFSNNSPFSLLCPLLIFHINLKYLSTHNQFTKCNNYRNIQWWAIAKSNAKLNLSNKVLLSSFSDVILYKGMQWSSDESVEHAATNWEAKLQLNRLSETNTAVNSGLLACCRLYWSEICANEQLLHQAAVWCVVYNALVQQQWVKEWCFTIRYIKILH